MGQATETGTSGSHKCQNAIISGAEAYLIVVS